MEKSLFGGHGRTENITLITQPQGPLTRRSLASTVPGPLLGKRRLTRPPSPSGQVVHTVSDVSSVQSHGGNWQRVPLERVRPRIGRGDVRTEGERNAESGGQHGLCGHFQFFKFCLLKPLRLGPSVLEPDFHLGFRQV